MPRKHKSSGPATPVPLAGPQRLNKLLAAAGLGSRREVEQYIVDGRVEVDGEPVTDLATKVDPETAKITFDNSAIKIFRPVYFALNKPIGVLSTNRDPSGRMRAIDLVNVKERIFSAGRLDRSSEGLMLLTNDGELVQRLSHPRYGVQKLYLATVQGEITQADLEKLTRGVRLAEGYAKVDAAKLRKQRAGAAELEIALSEGKNREIRRILARLGHKVVGLKRLAIGPLRLGQLPTGGWRPLTKNEIQALYAAAVAGRRKKRGETRKPLRGKRKPEDTEETLAPTLSAGQFDRYPDDEFADDFGPSLDEMSDEDLGGGDDDFVLTDTSVRGTIIPFEDDSDSDEDAPRPRRRPTSRENGPRSSGPRSSGPRSQASRPREGSSRSAYDLRSRKQASGGPRTTSGSSRGPSSGAKTSRKPAGSKSFTKSPRSGGSKSSAPKSGGPKSSGSKFGGQRSSGPKSGGAKPSGRPFKGGPRKSGGGPKRGKGPRR